MKEEPMNGNDNDLLMNYLGELGELEPCKRCNTTHYVPKKRTFTTWQDMGDLKDRLMEKGMWDKFEDYVWDIYYYMSDVQIPAGITWMNWLLNPARFCQLVADYLKEGT